MSANWRQTLASIGSVALAVAASSHHWLHMALLYVLGGSLASMSHFVWLRRFMIAVVLLTAGLTVYRLIRHRNPPHSPWLLALHAGSVLLSLGFVGYTLFSFGW